MPSSALMLVLLVFGAATALRPPPPSLHPRLDTVIGEYGETITVPCPYRLPPGEHLTQVAWWKNMVVELLEKHSSMTEAEIYVPRVNISADSSLLISQGILEDQADYFCSVISNFAIQRYDSSVVVYKKPALPVVVNKAEFLEEGALTQLGTCVARDAHPAANLTWQKDGRPLVSDGIHVVVTSTVAVDSSTGLSTTSSTLQYEATKQDVDARFNCLSSHQLGTAESEPLTVLVHKPTKRLSLTVSTPEGPITEGDDVTLKCRADGNPPPSSYNFHLKNRTVLVENSDSYTLTAVTRDIAGEYKCSLVDDETIEASLSIAVSYLDLSLSPTGRVVKTLGEPLAVKMEVSASGNDGKVSWTKDGEKMDAAPEFGRLNYTDAGSYTCEVSSAGLTRRQSFDLVVEGSPVITNLTQNGANHNSAVQLACQAQGAPRPVFVWNVSTTEDESSYDERDGKATSKVTVVPNGQSMSVTCSVSSMLGADARTIVVSSGVPGGWPKLVITCVVMAAVLAVVPASMAYWTYRSRHRGSWTPNAT